MTTTAHTPGPWHFAGCRKCVPHPLLTCNAVRTADGKRVPNTPENLRIQAAAPALLAACEAMLRRGNSPADIDAAYEQMRAAVAAAGV